MKTVYEAARDSLIVIESIASGSTTVNSLPNLARIAREGLTAIENSAQHMDSAIDKVSNALALAMTICDAVPSRLHKNEDDQLANIGLLVNAHDDDGTHGYAVIRDAQAAFAEVLSSGFREGRKATPEAGNPAAPSERVTPAQQAAQEGQQGQAVDEPSGLLQILTDYLRREMPGGTVISRPDWWAVRIARSIEVEVQRRCRAQRTTNNKD